MSQMIEDAVQRIRETFGLYSVADWEQFLSDRGLDVWYDDLPPSTPAFITGDCVYIQYDLSWADTAGRAWHEAGHHCLHAGDRKWWRSRPQGEITVAKFERQAEEFAEMFPDRGA